jgi:hypothetical protein
VAPASFSKKEDINCIMCLFLISDFIFITIINDWSQHVVFLFDKADRQSSWLFGGRMCPNLRALSEDPLKLRDFWFDKGIIGLKGSFASITNVISK